MKKISKSLTPASHYKIKTRIIRFSEISIQGFQFSASLFYQPNQHLADTCFILKTTFQCVCKIFRLFSKTNFSLKVPMLKLGNFHLKALCANDIANDLYGFQERFRLTAADATNP